MPWPTAVACGDARPRRRAGSRGAGAGGHTLESSRPAGAAAAAGESPERSGLFEAAFNQTNTSMNTVQHLSSNLH